MGFVTAPYTARAGKESAQFLIDLRDLAAPARYGPFLVVQLGNDVSLDLADDHGSAQPQHYAFLVGETEFDQVFGRIPAQHLPYWADPSKQRPGSTTPTTGPGRVLGRPQRPLP